jgi:hypothetical protein
MVLSIKFSRINIFVPYQGIYITYEAFHLFNSTQVLLYIKMSMIPSTNKIHIIFFNENIKLLKFNMRYCFILRILSLIFLSCDYYFQCGNNK